MSASAFARSLRAATSADLRSVKCIPLVWGPVQDGAVVAAGRRTCFFRRGSQRSPTVRVEARFKLRTLERNDDGSHTPPPDSRVTYGPRVSRPSAIRHACSQFALPPEDGEVSILVGKNKGKLSAAQVPGAPGFVHGHRMFESPLATVQRTSLADVEKRWHIIAIREAGRIGICHANEQKHESQDRSHEGGPHVSQGSTDSFIFASRATWGAS